MTRLFKQLGWKLRCWTLHAILWLVVAGYLWDWLLALVLIVINFTVPGIVIPAVERMYFEDDPAFRYPPTPSWLSERQKFPVEFGVPLLVVALIQLHSKSLIDWHHFALALVEAFAIESTFKKWMNLVGKQRPDWFARLASGDAAKIEDGRTSYPSGHAAETFMSFGLLTFYLLAKLKLFTAQSQGHFFKVMVCLLPLGFAAFITMSRVAAYKHDFADVNAGIMIGLWSGILAYLVNYQSPFDHSTAAVPRARKLPPMPSWLKTMFGTDAAGLEEQDWSRPYQPMQ